MDMLQTTGVLNSGEAIDYAWGLVVGEYKGLKVVEHGGAWVGFRAALVRFPEQRFSVIILANLDDIDPSGLAFRVADIYLAGQLKEPPKEEAKKESEEGVPAQGEAGISVPKAELEALIGNWQDDRFGLWLTMTLKEGQLMAAMGARNFALKPAGPGKFVVPGRADIEIAVQGGGEREAGDGAHDRWQERRSIRFAKAAPLTATGAAALTEYAGAYVSEELLDAKYLISVDKDKLVLKTRDTPRAELKAMAPDKFTVPGYGLNIEFARGKGGSVSGFTVSVGRAAGIAFAKTLH